jgi:D-alanine--poly(phosphoribitol) ligase subunit 1
MAVFVWCQLASSTGRSRRFLMYPNHQMNANIAIPFFNNAQHHPERLALSVNQRDFSYGEFSEISERIAAWLRERSAGKGKLVGILTSRSWEAYAGLLAACWAGATYLPLNPDWPEQRLLRILESIELDALVVDERGLKILSAEVLDFLPKHILAPNSAHSFSLGTPPADVIVSGSDTLPQADPHHSPEMLGENDLAYIMFTSGTTGSPKGVMISVGNVSHFLAQMQKRYQFSPEDRVSQRHELSFDFAVLDIFITWLAGASLHVIPASQLVGPSRFIREKQLTVWFAVPSTVAFMRDMKMLSPGAFPSVRYTVFSGEPLSASAVESWRVAAPNGVIDNIYGPTETTVSCLGQICSEPLIVTEGRGTVSIGKPFDGMEAAIVDSSLHFLPQGEKGEIAVSGRQVARGYFNDEQKTAARFPTIAGKVWYLTGDLAYQDAEGRFHHLGRTDHQVKVLGHRVELEDVEAHLREVCAVESVAAVAWPVANGSAEGIVAFVAGAKISASDVREGMRRRVPKYMVPSQIQFLDSLPVFTTGKIDRKALLTLLSETSS